MITSDKAQDPVNLWNPQVTPQTYGKAEDIYFEHALEQYKMFVESAQQVSAQRASMNALFLTVQTLLITAFGAILNTGWTPQHRWLIVFPLFGVLLMCWFWLQLVLSYRSLNTGKFSVIEEFEKRLPTAPFVEAEWRSALKMHTRSGRYNRFTDSERAIPVVFMFLYLLGALTVMFS